MTDSENMIINYLKKVAKKMADALFYGRHEKDIAREVSDEIWKETIWHEIIVKQIKELGGEE